MTVDHSNLDLSRFRYSCPAWHDGFTRGRESGRRDAVSEGADWQRADWHRAKAAGITEGVEQ